jgi:tRNA U54 and U55 pseudouridine synthase Pus10
MIKTTIIDGVEVPILPAKAVEIVKNKRTGTVYASKQEFEQDVANPETDTTVEEFSQDVQITVASLSIFGKTK